MNANLTNPKCIWGIRHPLPLPCYDVMKFPVDQQDMQIHNNMVTTHLAGTSKFSGTQAPF